MNHEHNIVDSGKYFVIDPISRVISTESPGLVMVQGDHRSERYTFSIPANIEGHEMVNCNRVEIHFTNQTRNKKSKSSGIFKAEDLSINGENLTFSWLIERDATVHAGSLQFHICFLCADENNTIIYQWSTDSFNDISILARNGSEEAVAEVFPDIIGKLIDEYFAENPPAFTDEQLETIKGDPGYTPKRGTDYWTPEDVAEIEAYIDNSLGVIENGSY